MPNVHLQRRIAATPEAVFATITDHPRYPDFTPIRKAVLEKEGAEAPNGLGAIRALHVAGPPIREEVIAYEPPSRFAYRVLSGAPVKSQVGTVTLTPDAGGAATNLSYDLAIEPLVPFSGPVVAAVVKAGIGRLLKGVAAEAERRAP